MAPLSPLHTDTLTKGGGDHRFIYVILYDLIKERGDLKYFLQYKTGNTKESMIMMIANTIMAEQLCQI